MKEIVRAGALGAALLVAAGLAAPATAGPSRPALVRPALPAAGAPLSDVTRRLVERRRAYPHDLYAPGATPRPLMPLSELLAKSVLPAAADEPETLRLAIFRVDFLNDSLGDATTGDGRFDLRRDTGILVDPPPHNRDYLAAHAEALARYYAVQSYGGLVIEATVLPPGEDDAYHLNDTADYGPWAVEQSEDVILAAEKIVTESILAVDATGTVNFGDYDAFVVVHAGSDFQSDINNDTPGDIPTFTLDLGEPLAVTGGEVDRVLILPETVNQDDALAALNGVFAHEFGHVLGLPDLYNIYTGVPQVGYWSLMDSGENIPAIIVDPDSGEEFEVRGVFPTSFDPWCKLQVFGNRATANLVPSHYQADLEATEVHRFFPLAEIDLLEYFLFENRAWDLDGNGFPYVKQDSLTGVFLGPVDDPDLPGEGGRNEYDALLPGSGVLVWHIDDKLVLPAMADRGQVNLYTGMRGIQVVEADGIWDAGRFNYGVPEDPFFEGNNTRLAPDTVPSSAANDGSYSGITVEVSGVPSRHMGLTVTRPLAQDGWPFAVPERWGLGPVAAVDLDGDGSREVLFSFVDPQAQAGQLRAGLAPVTGGGRQFAFTDAAGQPVMTGFVGGSRVLTGLALSRSWFGDGAEDGLLAGVDQSGILYFWHPTHFTVDTDPLARIDNAASWTAPVILAAGASAGRVAVVTTGKLSVYDQTGTLRGSHASLLAPQAIPTAGPTVLPEYALPVAQAGLPTPPVAVAWTGGALEVLSSADGGDGAPVGRRFASDVTRLVAGAFAPDGAAALVAATADSMFALDANLVVRAAWALPGGATVARPLAAGDLDADGVAEIVAALDDGTVEVRNGDGSPALGWPRAFPGPPRDLKLADLDGDGRLDLLLLDAYGVFHGLSGGGDELPDWPRPLGPISIVDSWLEDLDGDGLVWVASAGGTSMLAVRLPEARTMAGDWRYPRGTLEGTGAGTVPATVLADRPDLDGRPLLVYPNPSRGQDVEIRFVLDAGETADLALYDATGRELPPSAVDLRGGPQAGENAARWRVGDVAPGLYVCRLERKGPGGSRVDFARIAVLR